MDQLPPANEVVYSDSEYGDDDGDSDHDDFNGPKYDYSSVAGDYFDGPKYDYSSEAGGDFDGPKYDYSSEADDDFDGPKYDSNSEANGDFDGPKYDHSSEAGSFFGSSEGDSISEPELVEPDFYDRIPDIFLRGLQRTNWKPPQIEPEWSNGVPGGLDNVVPVTHDLVIGRYGSRAYSPKTYIPKSQRYIHLSEIQLRNLIYKRNHLEGGVSFPMGFGRDMLIRYLEGQDDQLGPALYKKHYGNHYQPIMPEPDDWPGMYKLDPELAQIYVTEFSEQLLCGDLSLVDQDLVSRHSPRIEDVYTTGNGMVVAAGAAMLSFRSLIDYGAVCRTGDYDPFHGLRALAISLHTARVRYHIREGWDHEDITPITLDMMIALLFGNTACNSPSPTNPLRSFKPTKEYSAYIDRKLFNIPEVFKLHSLMKRSFVDAQNLRYSPSMSQMMAIVDLLFERGLLDRPYSLGIILQGERSLVPGEGDLVPSTAVILGDCTNAIVWISRGREESLYWCFPMHWDGFGFLPEDGEDLAVAQTRNTNWGLRKVPIQDDIVYAQELRLNHDRSHDDPAQALIDFMLARKCDACRGDDAKPCIGRPCVYCEGLGQPCRPLLRNKLIDESSKPGYAEEPAGRAKSRGLPKLRSEKKSNDKLAERKRARGRSVKCKPWDEEFLHGSWEFYDQRLKGPQQWTAEPAPDAPHYLVVTCSRVNSNSPDAEILRDKIHNSSPEFARAHERLLLMGLRGDYAHLLPTAERPGGKRTVRRNMYLSFIDKPGHIGISGLAGGLQLEDESAECFAALIDEILTPGNKNLPLEINFLVRSFDGLFTGFGENGLGARCGGLIDLFVNADLDNETNLLDRIFITVCVDPEFVDGQGPISLHYPFQSVGFVGLQGRMYAKYKLLALVHRYWMAKQHEIVCKSEGRNRIFQEFPHNDDYWNDRVRNGVFIDGLRRDNGGILD